MQQQQSIAYGTYRLNGNECYNQVLNAIKIGYRIIDTASLYKNHKYVGDAINKSIELNIIKREDIFIISKIHNKDQRTNNVYNACKIINEELNLKPDLILLHTCVKNKTIESWKQLEHAIQDNLTTYIGVSNFDIDNLQVILNNCIIKPYLNQIEISIFYQRCELVNFCINNNIIVQGHSVFTNKSKTSDIYNIYNLMLLWCKKINISVVIGSTNYNHIYNNLEIFNNKTLTDDEYNKIKQYDEQYIIYKKFNW